MSNKIDGISFYANQYKANLQMSIYNPSAKVDLSLVEKYISKDNDKDDTTSGTTGSTNSTNKPTEVKNSSELLDEFRKNKSDSVKLSNTLNGFSSLAEKADMNGDETTQKGVSVLLQVLSKSGGSEAVNTFTDEFSSLDGSSLNKIFNQVGNLSESNATVDEVSAYIATLVDLKDTNSKDALNGFLNGVNEIFSKDYTQQATDGEVTNNQYKREVLTEFLTGVDKILSSSNKENQTTDALKELFETVENSKPDNIIEEIKTKVSQLA